MAIVSVTSTPGPVRPGIFPLLRGNFRKCASKPTFFLGMTSKWFNFMPSASACEDTYLAVFFVCYSFQYTNHDATDTGSGIVLCVFTILAFYAILAKGRHVPRIHTR